MNHRYNERRAQERENKMRCNDQEGLDQGQETTVTLSFFPSSLDRKGSCAICETCDAAHRVMMHLASLTSTDKWRNKTRNCTFCPSDYHVPHQNDFPLPLLNQSREVIHALRPVHLFIGDHDEGVRVWTACTARR